MKTKRHAKILDLIAEHDITTQEELLGWLAKSGFAVTQATVSRDIKELRLIKTLEADGHYRYTTSASDSTPDISAKFFSIFQSAVMQIDYAGQFVVIKCHVGMANAVCVALDSLQWNGVVGTLAGDDTIFVLMRSETHAANLTSELKKYQGA